ncbi:hypothetical protein O3Q51_00015 [Cryomorphaceae bacterium 1068]|nr:hypothetical protein [Cryomorphaceae bacterium 1068]
MLLRTFTILCFALLCSLLSKGQNLAEKDTIPVKQEVTESTEEVDGLLAFAGYLGKKLYDGLSDQFDEEQPEEKAEVKRVRIKLGPIKIERIEKR